MQIPSFVIDILDWCSANSQGFLDGFRYPWLKYVHDRATSVPSIDSDLYALSVGCNGPNQDVNRARLAKPTSELLECQNVEMPN
jgi:hypothetical protein